MKLLFVVPEYLPQSGGGLITFYGELLPELVRHGHEVTALVGSGVTAADTETEIDGVRVRFLPLSRLQGAISDDSTFDALPELRSHLAAARALHEMAGGGALYDVVETTDWGLLALPWLAAKEGPPVVIQLHGSIGQIDSRDPLRGQALYGVVARTLEAAAFPFAHELQTYSSANAESWRSICGREVRMIRPALRPGTPGESVRAGGVAIGRVQKWKGVATLCESLGRLGGEAPLMEWIGRDTVASGGSGSFSTSLARRYPDVWERRLRWAGALTPSALSSRLRRAEFAVVPSTWDVFNFTLVEAMAASTPVIASDGAGASELIEDGRNGFVFPAGDATALADFLRRMNRLRTAERAEIGNAGRETVVRELSPSRSAEIRISRYEELRGATTRASRPLWLSDLATPRRVEREALEFLHQLPLSGILRHAKDRILSKARLR